MCTVTAFGEGFYCRALHEGESMVINWISYITEEKSASFSLNMILEIFGNLEPINLPSV